MNFTEIECDECGEHYPDRRPVIDLKAGTMTLPAGWRWAFALCNWGNGITWKPVCSTCAAENPKRLCEPSKALRKRALKGVGEWAHYPEEREASGEPGGGTT